jgi:hypothetical protein
MGGPTPIPNRLTLKGISIIRAATRRALRLAVLRALPEAQVANHSNPLKVRDIFAAPQGADETQSA